MSNNWIRTGITGQNGFIGRNLTEYLETQKDIVLIPCPDKVFEDNARLREFVSACDVIVHLAAISRHPEPQLMYEANMTMVKQLITAMETEEVTPHVLFASTTHEAKDTPYHNSKREARKLLDAWAKRSGGNHTGLLMPNTFGPYGKPFYNSVVSTFCRQIADGATPEIISDSNMQLIYVKNLCREIYRVIKGETCGSAFIPTYDYDVKVSSLLSTLQYFRREYQENSRAPELKDQWQKDLFTTFQYYINNK